MGRDNKDDFNDPVFARKYINHHTKLLKKIGLQYAEKLKNRDFENGKMLDAGCGFGEMDIVLANHFPESEIIGIDLSEPMLEYANEIKFTDTGYDNIQFNKGDITRLLFEDQSFDVVFCVNMVHFIDNPHAMLNEINRVLKPTGYLFIKDLRYSWLKILEDEIGKAYSISEVKKLIQKTDLRGRGKLTNNLLWWNYEIF